MHTRPAVAALAATLLFTVPVLAQKKRPEKTEWTTPALPGGKTVVTERSDAFLKPTETLRPGVTIAKTPPAVDFLVFPGQTYAGKPWSAWGDSVFANGKYYASIGNHLYAGAGRHFPNPGTAIVYEYDPAKGSVRCSLSSRRSVPKRSTSRCRS